MVSFRYECLNTHWLGRWWSEALERARAERSICRAKRAYSQGVKALQEVKLALLAYEELAHFIAALFSLPPERVSPLIPLILQARRSVRAFVSINCAALGQSLISSKVFWP
jgi:hypothetical protein